MVSGVKGRAHVTKSRMLKKLGKSLMSDSCNFVLKYSKLSIDFSAPPLSVPSLKSLLFAGEAWNLIGTARGMTFDLLLKILTPSSSKLHLQTEGF